MFALFFGVVIGEVFFVEFILSKFAGSNNTYSDKKIKEMEEGIPTNKKLFVVLNDQIISDITKINNTATLLKTNVYSMFIHRRINELDVLADELNNI